MIKQVLLGEFMHEAENTRKLLQAVPDAALDYRPQPFLWSVAELATHIATIYAWYEGVFSVDVFNFDQFHYEHPDYSKKDNILAKFEENFEKARQSIAASDENHYMKDWTMKHGDKVLIGPMQKMQAIRSFLYNHLYHHRGELVAHLRASGHKVPALYGPTYEQSKGQS
ncbi:MAG: damage-inducible protein DinB [Sphingobacteriales bacterium]|nr:MAG: damage-inducible protein DinB [Sphingobacteriales bacterium]